jgi:hypothetical protein
MRCALLLLASLLASATGLRVGAPARVGANAPLGAASAPRARPLLMSADGDGSTEVRDDQLVEAAGAATGAAWPEVKPQPPAPDDTTVGPSEGFDPRIIAYVGLPALVLVGQLFFTFSRDALGDTALGPAIMDLWVPY